MSVDPDRARTLSQNVSRLTDPAERSAYLDRECGSDTELREQVETLVRADATVTAAAAPESVPPPGTTSPAAGATASQPDRSGLAGVVVAGRYRLVDVIGEGGMGSVWRAQQTDPVKRLVAVKLIRAGMDSRQVLARFDAERQALAMMDHPNIAKVLDGGLHDGRPFFVMELVQGAPITQFCDARRLTPRQRLELFVSICQAIQHAHQKGIIHRDIKPSNVLVALYDDKPVVKVIDFGVAKAVGVSLTEQTIDTGLGGLVGTPQYMSPEQASIGNQDIDTRSDVYSLGVLLYEFLAGSPPFSGRELAKKGLMEMLRVVREDDPPRPSSKLSTADALPSISANRGVEPRTLTGLLRDELDWVVMKALEKDRARRYETANGFAADVLRYLAGEPVQAHPPSAAYRARKFVRRHRTPMIAASLVLLALLAGIAGTTWGLFEARRQEGIARKAAIAEKTANDQAQKRLTQIEKGNAVLTSIFKDLDIGEVKQGADPLEAVLAQRLVKAAEQLEGESIGDPLVVVQLQNQMGESLLSLGHADAAMGLFAKARQTSTALMGADHADTLTSMHNLAVAYQNTGKLDQAVPLFEEALKLRKAKLGDDHPDTLRSMVSLAGAYQDAGKLDLALPRFVETLKLMKAKLGVDHRETLWCMNSLALAYLDLGKLDLAVPLLEETLRLRKAKLGTDHPDTLSSMSNLAGAFQAAGKQDLAVKHFEETLKLSRAKLGDDHPTTLTSMGNLALAYQAAGKLDLAVPLHEETLKLTRAKLGDDHPDTLISMNNLGNAYWSAGKLDLALPLLEETRKLMKAKLGDDHPTTLAVMSNLAYVYQTAGKLDLALPLHEETLKLLKAKLGDDHPNTLLGANNLALAYWEDGKLDLALPLFQEDLKLMKAKLGDDHPTTLTGMNNLALAYVDAGQLGLAVPLFEEALKRRRATLGADHSDTLDSMYNLAGAYTKAERFLDAEQICRECLAIREKVQPDSWSTFDTISELGGALLGQKKYAEAEPLLLQGHDGMNARKQTIPPSRKARIAAALDRLVALYSATDKPEEAAKYKELRAQYPPPRETK